MIREGSPSGYAVESALMVYQFAACRWIFTRAHFDVRKGNESVEIPRAFWRGTYRRNRLDYFYSLSREAIDKSLAGTPNSCRGIQVIAA